MCGIAGMASREPDGRLAGSVGLMSEALRRRGPDGSGVCHWDTATLGHRRLAIFDLSERGRQPMLSPDGSTGIVFNGAIYNFRALRRELETAGYAFRSETDTEVLLHGYRHWGMDQLTGRLAGMFAFALWDDRSRELFLVRDRLGVKPLLYVAANGVVAFASTARALRDAGFAAGLDEQSVIEFLEWGVVPEQRSIYQGVEKLPPATIARWHDGRLTTRTYWHPAPAQPAGRVSFEEAVERTESLLRAAVARRTQADVPIGALLSGGVDSALICWALRESGADIAAYTFAAPGEPEDESADARATAQELGIPLTVLSAEGTQDDWQELVQAYGEPFACASALGMLRLSAAAREAVTVLLTGDGGDDVFLGYPHHRSLQLAERLATLTPASLAGLGIRAGLTPPASGPAHRARNFAGYVTGGLGAFLKARASARYFRISGLLGPRLAGRKAQSEQVAVVPGSGRSILGDYLEFARNHQFVAEYLTKVDGATMHHALEARSPFLDHELWEYAAGLPYAVRLRGGTLKAVLREIARRRISERVASGRKRGFEVPVGAWLRTRWKEPTERLLESSRLAEEGWLNGPRLHRLVRDGTMPGSQLWYTVVLESWLRHDAPAITTAPAIARRHG